MAAGVRNYLAFDFGAESGRAILGRIESGRLTLEERHRFANPSGRMGSSLQWDLLAQWEQIKTGLRKAAGRDGGVKLSGIGIDTWGVDFGLIGPGGAILGNPVHYRDARTNGIMEQTFQRVSRQRIFDATGIQLMQFNTLFQLLALTEQNPGLLKAAEILLFMPDLFSYLLTGQRKSESTIASTSQMIDPRTGTWATALVEELGLPTRILPPIVPAGTVVGPLLADVADECGGASGPVIAPATHDTGSAVAAVPAEGGEDWCYISSGTWSLMGVELDRPLISAKAAQYNYTNEGGVGGTIRFLKNIMGLWIVQECRRQWQRDGAEHSYAALTQQAEQARPFRSIIDPDHQPFLLPGEMPAKIDRYCDATHQPRPSNVGEYVRAGLESLALAYRRTVEGLEDVLGRRIGVIHIVGGGTQNTLLNQMTADATGRQVIAGPVEATAIGNILVQAMAVGDIRSLSDARAIVRASFDMQRYEPRDTASWDRAYSRFGELTR
jgi:rhamnulokinase